jgi:DNA adenine methylase
VFFHLNKAPRAILSDTNSDLIHFYSHLRCNPNRLLEEFNSLPNIVSRRAYYRTREEFNRAGPSYRRSAQFFFLNRLCFNGVYRVNQFGSFNVPMGSRRTFQMPSIESLTRTSTTLRAAKLRPSDFGSTRRYARRGSLFYIDPPYTASAQGHAFDRYSWPPFREPELLKLGHYLDAIAKRGASVVVSYAGQGRPSFVPSYFHVKTFTVYRSISVNGSRSHYSEICAYYP